MAGGLAEVAARAGFDVVVASRRQDAADRLVQSVDCGLARAVERGKSTDAERQAILSRIAAVEGVEALAECDLVIESVVEDLAVKVELFGALDKVTKPSTILATNTSTLPVIDVALATSRPDLVCGIHFFNPATVMTLVEVVRPLTASDATIAAAMKFVTACVKEAVEVQDHAGFIVNALLFPYLNNAVRMLERGTATVESIDAAMRGGCNFPMGPFALLDLVGIDTSVAILNTIHASFGNACDEPAHTLLDMVAAGTLGRKTKHGFYQY
jgi:3-hydroxybutyryl-CoA dehydrogenase